jgi:hypothetical protein
MLKFTIAQFIPIIIIFLLFSSFRKVVQFSHTILGKLIAIIIIMFYTHLDVVLGVFSCALIILFYQSDIVENMLNMDTDLVIDPDYSTEFKTDDQFDVVDDYVYFDEEKQKKKESMMNFAEDDKDILINNEKLQDEFRKESCKNRQLVNKDVKVKYEMAEHVFPNIKFRRGACNPCLKTCDFSIIESKMITEKQLNGK